MPIITRICQQAFILLLSVGGAAGCQHDTQVGAPTEPEPRDPSATSADPDPHRDPDSGTMTGPVLDVVVGTWGPIEIRAFDVLLAAELHAFHRQTLPDDRLGDDWRSQPEIVRRMARIALDKALLRHEASRLGLAVDPSEIDTTLAETLQRRDDMPDTGSLDAALAPWPHIDPAVLRADLEDELLYQQWLDRAVTGLPTETVREMWDRNRHRVILDVVLIPNIPPHGAINEAVVRRADEIAAWYHEHRGFHTRPPRADIRLVRRHVPPNAPDRWWDEAGAEMNSLREMALRTGVHAVARAHSDDPSRANEGLTTVTYNAMPELFDVPVGEVSPVLRDRFGLYFAEVLQSYPPEQRELDDILRREIAATLLRRDVAWPEAMDNADAVIRAMQSGDDAAITAVVAERGLQRHTTPPFPRSSVGVVPAIGTAPELHDAIFDGALGDDELTPEPVRTPNGLVVTRILERRVGTETEWVEESAAFRQRMEDQIRERAWSSRLQSWDLEHALEIDEDAIIEAIADAPRGTLDPPAARRDETRLPPDAVEVQPGEGSTR